MPPLAPIVGSLAAAELLSCVFVRLIELESFLQHLCVLLACPDLDVVLAVLNLLYVFRYVQ